MVLFLGIDNDILGDGRTIVVQPGGDARFSWPITLALGRIIASLSLYHETRDEGNKLWTLQGGVQPKGQEMFNGRLKVKYTYRNEITVTIRNVNLNDAITFVVQLELMEPEMVYKSSVTLNIQEGNNLFFLICIPKSSGAVFQGN